MPAPAPVTGSHRLHLRLEGAVMFVAATAAWWHLGGTWGLYAACFLLPDVSFAAYLLGPRAGAHGYNTAHSLVLPGALAALGCALGAVPALLAAALWIAHIGLDRALGYGLKATTAFADTHLGRVGRAA